MFTGIIEETGTVQNIKKNHVSAVLTIQCSKVLENTAIGDSIAVNGVCLTVTSMGSNYFTADVMAETANRSSLGKLTGGSTVNLERAMAANGRFGGHIVSGHIDSVGYITDIVQDENAVWYTITIDKKLTRYIVEKGSVTLDGISLTVASVDEDSFKVSTIPHTRLVTNLKGKQTGDMINVECDMLGKYVEKLLQFNNTEDEKHESKITMDFLRENGF
ncbi:MAG: riboflavin synthase [Lachnospiraceae bacterium]|nr:riboflavin synthase [Lachnospiraceae bacterium]